MFKVIKWSEVKPGQYVYDCCFSSEDRWAKLALIALVPRVGEKQ